MGGKLWFYRERSPFIDVILFWISSTGNFVTLPVECLKRELIDHCNMDDFPEDFDSNIPFMSERFVSDEGVEIGGTPWKVKDEASSRESFEELFGVISTEVDKWFKVITTDESLYYSYSINMQEKPRGAAMKAKLLGGK